ncbi:prepilin-type N-terminal cleavage/methylation domain-containing protein, partial [Legionella sp.]|uniref:PilW family protein n=1 Tax=Legionella sp. TaxID=459 RepID=UPI00321F9E15
MRKQRGIGLVELMVSVLLTSILVILATQQYLVSKRQYFHVHTLLEQDFELQLINDLLRDSVRRAGFTPCLSINSLHLVDQRNSKTKLSAIEINEKHDQLKIRRMSEYFTTVI